MSPLIPTADDALLRPRRLALIGYGAQGRAQALNLRDGGYDLRIGLYPQAPSASRALDDGMRVVSVAQAAQEADLVAIMLPDERIPEVFRDAIAPHLAPGHALVFAHGFAVHYRQIVVPEGVDVLLVAPMGQGQAVRDAYLAGGGVPCLVAAQPDATGQGLALAAAYAAAQGALRAGVIASSFEEETETDLFAEQVVLVGGINSLIRSAFATLTEAGYQPEIAYISCLHEIKAVVDVLQREGLAGQRARISNTAEYGADVAGPRLVDERVRATMRELLAEIRDGSFARRWIAESQAGAPSLERARRAEAESSLERVGRQVRAMMPWLKGGR